MNADAPRVEKLDTRSQITLREWLGDATRLGIDLDSPDSIERAYERYVDEVLATPQEERVDPTPTLTAIAIAMGEYIRRNSDAQWRIVTDEQGRDLALSTAHETQILFPIDPVADSWAAQARGWLVEFVRAAIQMFKDGR